MKQAMQKEQLAAVHLHPRVRIVDDDLRPRDYDTYQYTESEMPTPSWKLTQR